MTTAAMKSEALEGYLAGFEKFLRELPSGEPEGLGKLRRQAIERFGELGFPSSRLEDWRFTNVRPIAKTSFRLDVGSDGVAPGDLSPYVYDGSPRLVAVNGRFAPSLSDLGDLPDGVIVTGLADALARHPDKLEPHLGRHASFTEHPFVALNTAFLHDGALVYVPRNMTVEVPVSLLFVGRPAAEPIAFFPRLLILAEENSQVTVVEQHATVGEGVYFSCPVVEIVTGPNAVVDHYKLQRETTDAFHMATLQLLQQRSSTFSSHSISWGGGLVRNDVNAILDGEGCDSILNGLYMVEGRQLVDNHMRVEHVKAHCGSHELYKGILEGSSRAVFNGRIYVHPGAQKTDAKQTNRNLLLSRDALCNSNPQLEIFADDVRCTHGSTVGQLDEEAIFYLRSRGIGEVAARSLLTYAFAADIVERIKVRPLRQDLEEFLFRRLPRGEIVRQAV